MKRVVNIDGCSGSITIGSIVAPGADNAITVRDSSDLEVTVGEIDISTPTIKPKKSSVLERLVGTSTSIAALASTGLGVYDKVKKVGLL